PPAIGALLMAASGLGWGLYSLIGKGAADPLAETAANFVAAAPIAIAVAWIFWDGASAQGAILATISGVVTSGLGYALWYRVLPSLDASAAALSQLCVPVLAFVGGAVFLAEPLTVRFAGASVLVLGGLALGILWRAPQRSIGSKGS
ncbi:MAG: EamA family transporter, partial [Pseudomonadota bacterium]